MRLLLVVTKGVQGGAQQYVASLATGMRVRGWAVEVALGVGEELPQWCRQQGFPVHRVSLDNPINPPKDALAGWQLYRLMRRGHYDVAHINSTKAGIVGLQAARRAGVPVRAFTAHGFRSILLSNPWQRRFWTAMERRYLMPADRVIAVSGYELQTCVANGIIPASKAVVIHNGVSLERVDAAARVGRQRREFCLAGRDLVVGTVARLDAAKGMECWIRAAARIAAREPRARFVIIGEGPETGRLRLLAAELGIVEHIIWAGQRVGVEYLPIFDVFLLTSLYEGFSIAVLEAMAARLPVVATRVGGNPEAIVDGETGLLAPSCDAHALAEAVLSLLTDEPGRRAMGQRARARVEREFTEEKMVARVAALYEELLMERAR
jgi:glycosyltransferase involved in cell wall biosynthesis